MLTHGLKMVASNTSLSLEQLLEGHVSDVPAHIPVRGVVTDSRRVEFGDVFFARPGLRLDGRHFISEAIERGAAAVVAAGRLDMEQCAIPVVSVSDFDRALGDAASRFFGHPSRALRLVGVTGTNGKTTIAHLLGHALAAFETTGVIGTLGAGLIGDVNETGHTTPEVVETQRLLREYVDKTAKFAVMEVSSHGIAQGRIEGLTFHTAIFTNLTRDHLDYHGDMRSYAAEKAKLFAHADLQYGVFNADDVYSTAMKAKANGRALWYRLGGRPEDDVLCGALAGSEGEGITLEIDGPYGKAQLNSPLIGRFNAYNLLASVAALLTLDISLDDACLALGQVKPAPGRMQWLGGQDEPVVVVDYCHTPDSLRSALSALRPVTARALWCVFGCGGDRDPGKRPEMGAIAVAGSDCAVLTDDNPRSEASQDIIDDVLEGIEDEKDVLVLPDRGAAIEHAIKNAVVGDVILIAGKGHETYQERDGVRHPFSDVAAARNALSLHHAGYHQGQAQ